MKSYRTVRVSACHKAFWVARTILLQTTGLIFILFSRVASGGEQVADFSELLMSNLKMGHAL